MTTPTTDETVVRRPGRRPNGSGSAPNRVFRATDEEWKPALEKAHARGETLSTVLRRALVDYARDDT